MNVIHVLKRLAGGGGGRVVEALIDGMDFKATIIGLTGDLEYCELLRQGGHSAEIINEDFDRLARWVKPEDVLIVHRSGEQDASWDRFFNAVAAIGCSRVLERNIFGFIDRGLPSREVVSRICLNSMHSLWRAWRFSGRPSLEIFLERHAVIYNPVVIAWSRSDLALRRADMRARLRIPLDAVVIGDVCRPAAEKLDSLLWAAAVPLLEETPSLYVVTRSYPAPAAKHLARRLGSRYINLDPSFEPEGALEVIACLDVLTHFSSMGESFGMAIAEALRLGVPVVANLTPGLARNNAQYELLYRTGAGITVNTIASVVESVVSLVRDAHLRNEMVRKSSEMFDRGPLSPQAVFAAWSDEINRDSSRGGAVSVAELSDFLAEYDDYERHQRGIFNLRPDQFLWRLERRCTM